MLGERAAAAEQQDARNGLKLGVHLRCDQIRAKQEDFSARVVRIGREAQLTAANERFERTLQILLIRACFFVDDDHVGRELLCAPVFMRSQQLTDHVEIVGVVDARQNDGQVAGNPLRPERGLFEHCGAENSLIRAQCRIGAQDGVSEPLKKLRFVGADAEMPQFDLRLRPGKSPRALKRACIAILVGEVQDILAGGRHNRGKNEVNRFARRDVNDAAQAHHRVENGADRVRERPAVDHGNRTAEIAGAADETRAVGFILQLAGRIAFDDKDVRQPDGRFLRRTLATRGQQHADIRDEFGFDEQIRKSGMGFVAALRC